MSGPGLDLFLKWEQEKERERHTHTQTPVKKEQFPKEKSLKRYNKNQVKPNQ